MNWDAIAAVGEILGASAVVLTLGYLAVQVRDAKRATSDQNRLSRATAVREMALAVCSDDQLRWSQMQNWGLEDHYQALGAKTGVTAIEASRVDWANGYYFWMYWGQFASTHGTKDRDEIANVLRGLLTLPGMRTTWETSPLARPLLEPDFVAFVDEILEQLDRESDS